LLCFRLLPSTSDQFCESEINIFHSFVFWVAFAIYSSTVWERVGIGLHLSRKYLHYLGYEKGRAIAQAVSRWLPTAAARVRSRVWSSGICDGQSGAGAGFLRVLRFPLSILFHKFLHNDPHLSSGAGTIGQKWPQYKGISSTPLLIKK
jgi:hypothetical protein